MIPKIQIKKYENRRLYNVGEKRYISLEEVRKLILEGNQIEVLEMKTGKDITHQVLFQTLMETENEKLSVFPEFFLHFLIKSPPAILRDYFGNFFSQQLDMYQKNREMYLGMLNTWSSGLSPLPGFDNPFARMFENPFFTPVSPSPEPEITPEPPPEEPHEEISEKKNDTSEIDDLKQMLNSLAAKISSLEKK